MAKKTKIGVEKPGNTAYNNVKGLEHLTLANSFVFYKVMQDPKIAKRLLEMILNVSIDHIEYLEGEKTIDARYGSKGIRLDIYVRDQDGTVYDVEMQITDTGNLPQRSRYYQGLISLDSLSAGEGYKGLRRSIVIFICMWDVFQKGRHIYPFEYRCTKDTSIALGDGTQIIFLNPYSTMRDVKPELAHFLQYLVDGEVVDEFTERVDEAVEKAKLDPMFRVEYMSYYANLADHQAELKKAREEGNKEGRKEGWQTGLEDGRKEGQQTGLEALVHTLKPLLPDFESVYDAIIQNEAYSDCGREEVEKYY